MSVGRETDEEDVAHMYKRMLLSHKKNNNIFNIMDGPRYYYTKRSQKAKCYMISFIREI